MKTLYIGYGSDQLENVPPATEGQEIVCPNCADKHLLLVAHADGDSDDHLLFYRCNGKPFLAGVNGKLTMGIKPQVS